MNSPYINTKLYSRVALAPNQLENEMYKHLKNNLIKKLQGKCYKSYGYITKIYKIDERSEGKLVPEDTSASVFYNVKFSCRLCKPLKNSIVVCEIIAISKSLIYLKNGPIDVFILDSRNDINPNNFVYDERKNELIAHIGENKGIIVTAGTFLKVKVKGVRLEHKNSKVVVIGTLENLATEKETDESILKRDDDDDQFQNYDEYNKITEIEKTNAISSDQSIENTSNTSAEEKPKKTKKSKK